MNRREAIIRTSAAMGMSLIGAQAFLTGCQPESTVENSHSSDTIRLLNEVAEVILPETEESPGAAACRAGEFIQSFVLHCYSPEEQKIFNEGLINLDRFEGLNSDERVARLTELDTEARGSKTPHFYTMIKQLTILCYFSSQPGVTESLRYNPQPGSYDGCVPYKKGENAWYGPLSSIG